jgi:hypothetical protein
MIGCLKLLLNLTYNHNDACENVRIALANEITITKNTISKNSNKIGKKGRANINENKANNDTNMEDSTPLGGIAVLLSLLNIRFDEDMFDIHQHVIGLLINLVCFLSECGIIG